VFLERLLERRRVGGPGELGQRVSELLLGIEQVSQLVYQVTAK
jgi:hypothetical protein